jgi:Secretion system C-terminal sorting domain
MKKLLLHFALLVCCQIGQAQNLNYPKSEKVLYGNNRPQNIVMGGVANLFASFTPTPGLMYKSNIDGMFLWLGGKDSIGNTLTAIKSYGNKGTDFYAGPNLQISEDSLFKNSKAYDKIWKMTALEITAFQEDLKDGVLNSAFPNIMAWPARNNPNSLAFNGFQLPENVDLAPFKDVDKDGVYNPLKGDFPLVEGVSETNLPTVFYWCIYHDSGTHTYSKGKPMNVEVQQSTWIYDCKSDTILNNSMFFSYKIINKGATAIDSLLLGINTDTDFGCLNNNMVGCIPNQNTFWAYQNLAYNEDCPPFPNGKNIKPVIAVTFLNQPMSSFVATGYEVSPSLLPQNILPNKSVEYYNILNGKWAKGEAITCCGVGYEKNPTQAATQFLFPANPNSIGAWSMQQNQTLIPSSERASVGNVSLKKLLPNQSQRIDMAISYHQDTTHRKVLQATDLMYRNIPALQNAYNQQFINKCVNKVSTAQFVSLDDISIFPNPFDSQITIQNNNIQNIDYQLVTAQGQSLQKGKIIAGNTQTLYVDFLPKGIYFLTFKSENGAWKVEKLVK